MPKHTPRTTGVPVGAPCVCFSGGAETQRRSQVVHARRATQEPRAASPCAPTRRDVTVARTGQATQDGVG